MIAGLLALLSFTGGLSLFAVGPITPLIIDDYGITHSTASLLTSLVSLVHAGFAIPVSMVMGRVSLKNLIAVGSVVSSAPVLSFVVGDSFPFLLSLRAAYGLGFVILFPAAAQVFMQWFSPRELPLVNGIFIAFASLGVATSTFVVAPLSEAIGWDAALSTFGCASLFSAGCWIVLGRVRPNVIGIETFSVIGRVKAVLRSRSTFLVVGADLGPFALLTVALAWLPTYYNEVHGLSLQKAGILMGLLSLAGVFALALASLLALRVPRRRPFLIVPGILVGFAGFGSFLLADTIAVYLAVVALGFACWFYLPALVTIPMELYPMDPNRVSVIFASIMTLGGIATFLAPLIVGVLFDVTGSFLPGLGLFAFFAWSLGIAGFLLPETGARVGDPN